MRTLNRLQLIDPLCKNIVLFSTTFFVILFTNIASAQKDVNKFYNLETELLFNVGKHKTNFVPTSLIISPGTKKELKLTTDARLIAYAQQVIDMHSHTFDVLFGVGEKKKILLNILKAKEESMKIPDKADFTDLLGMHSYCCFTNVICIENDKGGWTCKRWCCEWCND